MSDRENVGRGELLEVLACDITARPTDAPHFSEVADKVLQARREPGALVVDFDVAAAPTLERIVEAERRCCAEIGWHLERLGRATNPGAGRREVVRLRIEGSPAQVDAAALLIAPRA